MKHILLVLDYYTPHIGGIEKLFSDLASFLAIDGYRVTILTSRHDTSLSYQECIAMSSGTDIVVYRVGSSRYDIRWYVLRFGLSQKILFQSFDLIHTSTFSACLSARLLAWYYRKPITITIHELYDNLWYSIKGRKGILYKLYEWILLLLPRDHIITPSRFTQDSILRLRSGGCTCPVSVVYNQIDYEQWSPEGLSKIRNNGYPLVLFVGRMTKEKGLSTVIKALPSVCKKIPDCTLLIVTDKHDPSKESIDGLIAQYGLIHNVIWSDTLPNEAMLRQLMVNADVGVIPSLSEGFCYTAVQMQALGLPLVVRRRGALPEVLDDRGVIWVEDDDEESWSHALIQHCNHPNRIPIRNKLFSNTLSGYTHYIEQTMRMYDNKKYTNPSL